MKAGRLDRRITIQAKTQAASGSGELVESWTTIVEKRPASMLPVRGDERFGGDQTIASQQVEFRIRYSLNVAGLGPLHRIIYPALTSGQPEPKRVYDILAVHEIGRREGLQIITTRRPDLL